MPEDLRFAVTDHVGVMTLARPRPATPSRSPPTRELEEVVRVDDGARCLVITGADPAFCSGDDVKQIMAGDRRRGAERTRRQPRLTPAADALLHTDVPVVAAVNGAAVGWGMELALMADIRVASERAKFGELFVKRGSTATPPASAGWPSSSGGSGPPSCSSPAGSSTPPRPRRCGSCRGSSPTRSCCRRRWRSPSEIAANPPLAVQRLKAGLRRALDPDWHELGAGSAPASPSCSRPTTTARAWPPSSRSARPATSADDSVVQTLAEAAKWRVRAPGAPSLRGRPCRSLRCSPSAPTSESS